MGCPEAASGVAIDVSSHGSVAPAISHSSAGRDLPWTAALTALAVSASSEFICARLRGTLSIG